jgi:mono/diheme cytochrome c family protein
MVRPRMSTLLFVLVWIAIAVALIVYALFGGRRGGRRVDSSERRNTRLAAVGFVLLFVALVAALPYAIIKDVETREDVPEVNIDRLTADQRHGRELFAQRCKLCHSLKASNASAKVGPNLDELRPPKALTLNAIENGRARGNGQMPAELADGEDAEAIAEYVEVAAGRTGGE